MDESLIPDGTLVWEASRGGALFPHLYGVLTKDMVVNRFDLEEGAPLPKEVAGTDQGQQA